jgi:hypothetical protein
MEKEQEYYYYPFWDFIKDYWLPIAVALGIIFLICWGTYDSIHTEYYTKCSAITHKYTEQSSQSKGYIQTDRYLLLEDGRLKSVDIKTYIESNVGDKVCFTESKYKD